MESPLSYRSKYIAGLLSGLVFLLLLLAGVKHQQYLVWTIPLALLLVVVAISRIDIFFLVLLFLVPLSVQLRFIIDEPPADLFLPTEPMLVILLLLVFFRIFNSREFNSVSFGHPVSVMALTMLGWMFITSITSTDPLVSFKVLVNRTWFIAGFYLLSLHLFTNRGFIDRSLRLLVAGIVPVIIYNIAGLWGMGLFNQQAAHSTMWPFFNDHTSFGAAIAFIIPVAIYLFAISRRAWKKVSWGMVIIILGIGLLFSYSRAAWLSIVPAALFALILYLRISPKIIIASAAAIIAVVILSWSSLVTLVEENHQDSSANLASHVRSAANITTDASNLERINRWKAAARMIPEKPLLGWGPGTYQFFYAPYQDHSERTIISTNFGDRGNAHSEYIGAAVDSGIPGTIIYVMLLLFALAGGISFSLAATDRRDRLLMIAVVSGLITYVIHGFLNNFLDTDKISAPFWISMAIIVTLNIRARGLNRPSF